MAADSVTRLVLGVTATPYRHSDPHQLRQVFEHQAFEVSMSQLIQAGFLCKVQCYRVLTFTDISLVVPEDKEGEGLSDFNERELSKVINNLARNTLVAESYKRIAKGRKAVAFCCSVQHAKDLTDVFNDNGVRAEYLVGSNTAAMRQLTVERHKRGDFDVLVNVQILTEGYDDTSINCILMVRPTRSKGLYTQCIGRGLRCHPGKCPQALNEVPCCWLQGGRVELLPKYNYAWVQNGEDWWLNVYTPKFMEASFIHVQRVSLRDAQRTGFLTRHSSEDAAYRVCLCSGAPTIRSAGDTQPYPSLTSEYWQELRGPQVYRSYEVPVTVLQDAEQVLAFKARAGELDRIKEAELRTAMHSSARRNDEPTEFQM
ncbi:uncharacterized protein HaLaN_04724, partial [Haematococcus lacustris]